MLDLEIVPGVRIGPFALGLAEDELAAVCGAIEGYRAPESGRPVQRGFHSYTFGMFIKARLDVHGRVQAVQISGSGAFGHFNAHLGDVNLLTTPADDVIRILEGMGDLSTDEYAFRIVSPKLGLTLARQTVPEDDEDEDGRYFTSVLTAYPGTMDVTS